ncbi:MAG: glutamine--fructose-6-phosphate transaminase (isomerizing), partial [Clostridiales bacterium]|nr:glutamine--fructose-6-phosphate transaminase (isomerizing) [Clostridiales bacterium]
MCGIIGYTGGGNAVQKVIDGLASLEYRGYDSVGVGVRENGKTVIYKTVGRVKTLDDMIKKEGGITSSCVIGHTRWATHGAPSYENAHPHKVGAVTAVHNGIIENYAKIEESLPESERVFASQTDTEVAVALINHYFAAGLSPLEAIRTALSEIRGSYALGIIFDGVDDKIYIAKKDSPLIIGIAEDGTFLASDITAILKYTKKYVAMSDGDVAELTPGGYKIFDASGEIVSREICEAEWDVEAAEKCGYEHFMLKEISEEPEALTRTLSPRIKDGKICFDYDKISDEYLKDVKRLFIVACGTARHAGLMAKYYFERLCRIPVSVEVASEFRYSEPIINKDDTVMIISQSGETADSLAALRLAKELGAHTLAVVNVFASSIAREADKVLYTYAGPEIAVASTKAYTVQAALLSSLAVRAAYAKGLIYETELEKYTKSVYSSLPDAIAQVFSRRGEIEEIA